MTMKIIDAHAHLWLNVDTVVNGSPIHPLEPNRSRSMFFGEERQMLPPYMTDGQNTAERFLSNMDYAQVSAAVITQEFIDGLQNSYLMQVQQRYPTRFFCFGMPELRKAGFCDEAESLIRGGFRGIKVPAARLPQQFLNDEMMKMLHLMEQQGVILGIELMDGDRLVVPRFNHTVRISGSVNAPNTVAYAEGEKYKYYIHQAGGFAEHSKKSHAFIVYQNGTIAIAKKGKVEPGCEIVVPTKAPRDTRTLQQWLSVATTAASLGTMAASIANLIKK